MRRKRRAPKISMAVFNRANYQYTCVAVAGGIQGASEFRTALWQSKQTQNQSGAA
jgi:hypothetical protein